MISLTITQNDSPLKGTEGDKITMNLIRDRIMREAEDDVSLKVNMKSPGSD